MRKVRNSAETQVRTGDKNMLKSRAEIKSEEERPGGEHPSRDSATLEDNPFVLVRTLPFAISRMKHQHFRLRICLKFITFEAICNSIFMRSHTKQHTKKLTLRTRINSSLFFKGLLIHARAVRFRKIRNFRKQTQRMERKTPVSGKKSSKRQVMKK